MTVGYVQPALRWRFGGKFEGVADTLEGSRWWWTNAQGHREPLLPEQYTTTPPQPVELTDDERHHLQRYGVLRRGDEIIVRAGPV